MPDLKQSDEKGINPGGQGVAQPRDVEQPKPGTDKSDGQGKDEDGAASAGQSAGAEEDTYD